MNKEEKNFIFGIRAIIEAIEAGKTIDKLFIQKGLHNDLFAELWKLVRLKRFAKKASNYLLFIIRIRIALLFPLQRI